MKTIQFTITKANGLFVKLPDGAKAWSNELYLSNMIWYKTPEMRNPKALPTPKCNWQLQGFTTELTNEQMEKVCKDEEEFASLLESLGIEITENVVLLTSEK